MRLAIVLSDFFVRPADVEAAPGGCADLADCLRYADCELLVQDWRFWLARPSSAGTPGRSFSLALAAWRHGAARDARYPDVACAWFATPVHALAGLDHVRLHAQGCLRLTMDEWRQLAEDFKRDFAGSGWHLRPTADGRALLGSETGLPAVRTEQPERWLGHDLAPALPRGVGARTLRARVAELELWLFDSAVNRERRRRNLPAVTQLWPWDLSSPSGAEQWPSRLHAARFCGADAAAGYLVEASGGRHELLPHDLAACIAADGSSDTMLALSACEWGGDGLAALVGRWVAPAVTLLRRGELRTLQLVANDRVFTIAPGAAWKFWRRRRAWHDVLGVGKVAA